MTTHPTATERYTIISADCHAGGSMEQYAEYLDPEWRDEFATWRAKYASPWRDLTGSDKVRNWDTASRRADLERDGIVAEVLFPNTVPPFFPTNSVVAPTPTERQYPRRLAGVHAHNRWQADWIAELPGRRKGQIQVFLNDIPTAVDDIRRFHALGVDGGVLLPGVPPDSGLPPLFARDYDPVWQVCEELDLTVSHHGGGTGIPTYGKHDATLAVFVTELSWWTNRAVWHLIWGGVFERFPNLRFVLTEVGIGFVPGLLQQMDYFHGEMVKGRLGEIAFEPEQVLPEKPSAYFARNCFVASSFPGPAEAKVIRDLGVDNVMWGADYPHHEATTPYTRESLRYAFADWDPDALQTLLAGTAARVYGFDLDALAPVAAAVGPTHGEIAVPLDAIPADATSPAFLRS
jgi:predicted TIM-barrel fold metal-dependent hydrolase